MYRCTSSVDSTSCWSLGALPEVLASSSPVRRSKNKTTGTMLDFNILRSCLEKTLQPDPAGQEALPNGPPMPVWRPFPVLDAHNFSDWGAFEIDFGTPSITHIGPDMRILSIDEDIRDPIRFWSSCEDSCCIRLCKDGLGGNPAGVVLCSTPLSSETMQSVAADAGYSETAFIEIDRQQYTTHTFFCPSKEVALCGHATIAKLFLAISTKSYTTRAHTMLCQAGPQQIIVKKMAQSP